VRAAINSRLEELRFRSGVTVVVGVVAAVAFTTVAIGLAFRADTATRTVAPRPAGAPSAPGPARPPASTGPTHGTGVPPVAPKHPGTPPVRAERPAVPKAAPVKSPAAGRPHPTWQWQNGWPDRRHHHRQGGWRGDDESPRSRHR
jgi:hypothetical protein